MSRWNSYLNRAKEIIEKYDGQNPLSSWLKNFFREHKEMGSNDRRIVSELAFSFFRLGHSSKYIDVEARILAGLFLTTQTSSELLTYFKPEWDSAVQLSLNEKLERLNQASGMQETDNIFPWQYELSKEVDSKDFDRSFLIQPDLYLRVRPGMEKIVTVKLGDAGIPFQCLTDICLSLPNSTNVQTILELDKEVVIQDYNSQATGKFFSFSNWPLTTTNLKVWDCCAASGGKSIMAYDLLPGIQLTVSDLRESILHNLRQRFENAGIRKYKSFQADLSNPGFQLSAATYQLIIADVPCSGSGTWARTPEQLYFFDPEKIKYYSELQQEIVTNVVPALQPGGRLVYITCSVFKEENEGIVNFIGQKFNLRLLTMELLEGYRIKADSMFVAVFEK